GVSAATQDIISAHQALRATAQPLQAVAARTATLISSVERQVLTIGVASDSLDATSKHMKEVQEILGSSWREYGERFADVDRSLGSSLELLTNGFDLYGEKIRDLNAGLD